MVSSNFRVLLLKGIHFSTSKAYACLILKNEIPRSSEIDANSQRNVNEAEGDNIIVIFVYLDS